MRRLIQGSLLSILTAAMLLGPAACKRCQQQAQAEATDEQGQTLMPMVHVADQRAAVQLIKGFYDVEQNAWRWTMKKFK
jgi:hypothetical protein